MMRKTNPNVMMVLLVTGMIFPWLMGLGCFPRSILEGVEDEFASSEAISTFDGAYLDVVNDFGIEIVNRTGTLIIANSNEREVGSVVLVILEVEGTTFSGRWIFQDGKIRPGFGELLEDGSISMYGAGWSWTLTPVILEEAAE